MLAAIRTSVRFHLNSIQKRFSSLVTGTEKCSTPDSRGLVLGVYANEDDKLDLGLLTPNAQKYNEVYKQNFGHYSPVFLV